VPLFQKGVDYQFEYHKLFHDNEMKLQQYDKLLQDRVKDLKLFQSMQNGDYSHMICYKTKYDVTGSILAHQSTSEICKQLIPQLVKDTSFETSRKRIKQS
jgi:hypothetical protein